MSTMTKQSTTKQIQVPLRIKVANMLVNLLTVEKPIDRRTLSKTMTKIYGGTDAENFWNWKDAYDAAECAEIIHVRDRLSKSFSENTEQNLKDLQTYQNLQPRQSIRSENQSEKQQYSTPITLAYIASLAAALTSDDIVLEPSAGHGTLALFAKLKKALLILNEIDDKRAAALRHMFKTTVYQENAAYIDSLITTSTKPTVVLMNPPFSSSLKRGKNRTEAGQHIKSALARLQDGGRLIAIVGYNFNPTSPSYQKAWSNILQNATLTASIGLSQDAFVSKGVSFPTRLLVIDKGEQAETIAQDAANMSEALELIQQIPERLKCVGKTKSSFAPQKPKTKRRSTKGPMFTMTTRHGEKLEYSEIATPTQNNISDSLYVDYSPQRIKISKAKPHPTQLTQSVGLANIIPPLPTYQPMLPTQIVEEGSLSDAQLEAIIYAGEAHSKFLQGHFVYDPDKNDLALVTSDTEGAFPLRQGWSLADGTGVGKGRTISGIILDNWINGRRKAIWISKSSNLINDARRDLIDLGFSPSEIFGQDDYNYGEKITRTEGILFTTFALIRGEAKDERQTRLDQLIEWAGKDFAGVIAFDEGHSMANAIVTDSDRGQKQASLQGQAGLKIQFKLNNARIVYSSATSATTVENLGYMDRLGLWRGILAPFDTRASFIQSLNDGGTAAMEVVARDLKAMGLYFARNISFNGVTYDALIHDLTDQQVHIYNSFADAFKIIHNNLEAALEAANIKEDGVSKNRNAVGAARSAFESTKQRFFNHLLTSMKMPSVIKQMKQDIEDGYAIVAQLISTGEAQLTRSLATTPVQEILDGQLDMTPKEAIVDYIKSSFPTQLFEIIKNSTGSETAQPVFDETGQPVRCQEALQRQELLLETICALPSIPSALDQIIWHFGQDKVAEITGRSKRIVKHRTDQREVIEIQSRPASANMSELNAYMDDKKDIAVFSRSGAVGFSMHAALDRKNQRRRAHYIIEPGWQADAAIQGLGRSHRSNQKFPPLFRPVSTDVQGEKRFLSTISRRLNSLGALTKGERKTGGQNLFRPEDNLESDEARSALYIFFRRLYHEPQNGISLSKFEDLTGLSLTDQDGALNLSLPPIQRFLNRLLALRIEDQNTLFQVFLEILDNRIELAKAAGTLDVGAETIQADKIEVLSKHLLRTDPSNGAETHLLHIKRQTKTNYMTIEALTQMFEEEHQLMWNRKSKKVAIVTPTSSMTNEETGAVHERVQINTPTTYYRQHVEQFLDSAFETIDRENFEKLWNSEINSLPEFKVDEFGIVTGLLMPLWSLLKSQSQTVYRLNTETHGSILGRYIHSNMISTLLKKTGNSTEGISITPEAILSTINDGEPFDISHSAYLKLSKVMDNERIELVGYDNHWLQTLKSFGCFTEIIRYKTRVFIPRDETAAEIIGKIQKRYMSI